MGYYNIYTVIEGFTYNQTFNKGYNLPDCNYKTEIIKETKSSRTKFFEFKMSQQLLLRNMKFI